MAMDAIKPRVSVVLPVYQGEKYLREAIESILNQTFTDFEFIIIDDASTDRSVEIITSYDDPRISFTRNLRNLGLSTTLNKGLELSCGEYIARMDQDDVSLPERLTRQVAFMESHPELAASGAWARDIDSAGRLLSGVRETPVGERMKYDFWRPSPLIHPTAVIRASTLAGERYDAEAPNAEDYDFWLRLRKRHKIDNLPEYLLLYRVHSESLTQRDIRDQLSWAHTFFCRHTGLAISSEDFLRLVGEAPWTNPAQRFIVRWRLARAIGQPYRGLCPDDIAYARAWLLPRMTRGYFKQQVRRVGRCVRRLAPNRTL